MGKIAKRLLNLNLPPGKSAFLWGPRKVGKSYWIGHELLPHLEGGFVLIDLLKTDVFSDYLSRPALLRERHQNQNVKLIVIDEIQKVPALLDEVHWLIENKGFSFLMTGSSATKLRRTHANLLGGRAWRRQLLPLSYKEIEDFDLETVMTSGLLPPHFLSPAPIEDLRAYVADYLKEEIAAEGLVRNIPAFAEFLKVAAQTSSELLNYTNVGREVGVSAKVIRTYFEIMETTFLGYRIPPWTRSKNRRMIETEKFYLFDVGVVNFLNRCQPRIGSPEFGKSFENFILMELKAYQAYIDPELPIAFWRTSTGLEVDFLVGDRDLAIEIKSSRRVHESDTRGLMALREETPFKNEVIVCLEPEPRTLSNGIKVMPWRHFLNLLWDKSFFT
jgi:predicted AAA+ superfamily ATPase